MKHILFFLLILIAAPSVAQISYSLPGSSDTIRVGDKIEIGIGTLPDGGFKYIGGLISADANLSGTRAVVKDIKRGGDDKRGYIYIAKIWPGVGVVNYKTNLRLALQAGEIKILHAD